MTTADQEGYFVGEGEERRYGGWEARSLSGGSPDFWVTERAVMRSAPTREPVWWEVLRPALPAGVKRVVITRWDPELGQCALALMGGDRFFVEIPIAIKALKRATGFVAREVAASYTYAREEALMGNRKAPTGPPRERPRPLPRSEATRVAFERAFTEWDRRWREDPEAFESAAVHLLKSTPTTYGEGAAPYFMSILDENQSNVIGTDPA